MRACGANTDVAYDGANVSATNNGIWHFLHGPGTDDPLIGIGQQPGGANVPTKEFYWVTDGQGRQYAMAEATGGWEQDFNADSWPGFPQAGGIQDASGYNAGRSQGSNVPGVSYFRNRIYDQQSGQWTQEDPLGLAGGTNLYQYAGGNPAMFTDPFGLKVACADRGACKLWDQMQARVHKAMESKDKKTRQAGQALARMMGRLAASDRTYTISTSLPFRHILSGTGGGATDPATGGNAKTDMSPYTAMQTMGMGGLTLMAHEAGHADAIIRGLSPRATTAAGTTAENHMRAIMGCIPRQGEDSIPTECPNQ